MKILRKVAAIPEKVSGSGLMTWPLLLRWDRMRWDGMKWEPKRTMNNQTTKQPMNIREAETRISEMMGNPYCLEVEGCHQNRSFIPARIRSSPLETELNEEEEKR